MVGFSNHRCFLFDFITIITTTQNCDTNNNVFTNNVNNVNAVGKESGKCGGEANTNGASATFILLN
jgi:hypothetical protein